MNNAVAYTCSFLSFLIPKIKPGLVKNIILFGSATRDELTKESDIDLFIELYSGSNTDSVKKITGLALSQFYKSHIYAEWKLRGCGNEIRYLAGFLDKQSDLKRSIISNGIILYGKYTEPIEGRNYTLFSLKPISEKNKRYRVLRKLAGRKEKSIKTKGLINELGGKQVSTRVFLVPAEQSCIVLKLLAKEKIDYSMLEISTD